MFDVWHGDIELTSLVLIFSAVILLPLQLLLCFKAKNKLVRLIPVFVLSFSAVLFTILRYLSHDWSAMIYLIFSVWSLFMLLFSALGWIIWSVYKKVKKDR